MSSFLASFVFLGASWISKRTSRKCKLELKYCANLEHGGLASAFEGYGGGPGWHGWGLGCSVLRATWRCSWRWDPMCRSGIVDHVSHVGRCLSRRRKRCRPPKRWRGAAVGGMTLEESQVPRDGCIKSRQDQLVWRLMAGPHPIFRELNALFRGGDRGASGTILCGSAFHVILGAWRSHDKAKTHGKSAAGPVELMAFPSCSDLGSCLLSGQI